MLRDLYGLIKSLTRTESLLATGASLIFVTAFVFYSIGTYYKNTVVQPAFGGQYIEGVVGQPITINPVLASNNDPDRDLSEVLFTKLETLAEQITTSTSGKTFSVTLKQGLLWSDGEPLTSDDITFTLDLIQNGEAGSPLANTWQGVVAERLSERETRFTIKTPYIYFLDNLKGFQPIPRHIFETIPAANVRLSTYNLEPISSGPYRFSHYDKQKNGFLSNYDLEINPHFAGTRPHIPKFTFAFFQNYKDALDAFNKKMIDGLGGLDPDQLDELKIVHQVFELNIPRYYAIFFNQNVQTILKDQAVRQALNQATDKEALVATAFRNHALTVSGPLLSYIDGYDADVYKDDVFSLDDASSTLWKAGWKIGKDGVREKVSGKITQRLSLEMVVPQIPFLTDTADELQKTWASIGIELKPVVLPAGDIAGDILKSRTYQMVLFGNVLRGNPDVFSFWHSSQKFSPGLNLSLYDNKNADILLESVRKETNTATRLTGLSKLQKMIHDDAPAIFLYSPTYIYAGPKDLGGFDPKFIGSPNQRFTHVEAWYLKTTRVFR